MKNYILSAFLFLGLFALSGCGGGSDNISNSDSIISTTSTAAIETTLDAMEINGDSFNLNIVLTKKVDSSYQIELSNFNLSTDSCTLSGVPVFTPNALNMDGGINSSATVNIAGAFDQNCVTTGYTFSTTQTSTKDGVIDTRMFSVTYSADDTGSAVTPVTVPSSGFFNATTPLEITQVETPYEIKVQMVEDGYAAVGKTVRVKTFGAMYGTISNPEAVTGEDGYAVFNYTSPDPLPANGTSTTLELTHDDNGTIITQNIVLNFNNTGLPLETFDYDLINVSDIAIEHGGQKEDIKVQLTYEGIPIAGKTVQMLAFPADYGTILNSYSVVTDSLGYATFFYMAPETITDINNTTLNLTMQFNEGLGHIETNASVTFNETLGNIDGDVTLPIVVIPSELRNITLDANSQTFDIAIQVYKDIAPYDQGTVKVELPIKILDGVDVGQFAEYEVTVDAQGVALFNYTGPSNLQALIDNDDNGSIFKFYHIENAQNKQEMKVIYQAPSNPNVDRNYAIDVVASVDDFSMGIPDKVKTFNIVLTATDASGNDVSLTNENITQITVTSENTAIAQIWDPANQTSVDSLILTGNEFMLKSKTLSGLVPVNVTMEFDDANGDPQTLTTIVNVRVFSGLASAISISYVSTGQDVERSKYIETLAISVTDEYGNRVNTRPNISLGAIVGYAVDGRESSNVETNETKRLFYGRSDIVNGNADGVIDNLSDSDNKTTNFEDTTLGREDVFQYVNAEGSNTDKLVIFGERKNYEAMGKWDIALGADNHTLTLGDDYYGSYRSGLYYAVGHNYYQDQCREDGREWLGSTDSTTYQLDEEGTVTVTYKYDYHLTGKDALIWVNLDGIQPDTGNITRVGETVKHTLRGTGFTKVPTSGYSLPEGGSGYGTFVIWHENAPERYRNAHFAYAVKDGSTCSYTVVAQSNPFDARTCDNTVDVDTNGDNVPDTVFGSSDGTSYITFYLQAPADKTCNFDIANITVSSEF